MAKPQIDWRGSFAVIVTPFTADGAIDEPAYREIIDFVIGEGSHGLIAAGSTGEFFLMSRAERKRVFEIAVDQTAGRVPVLACPAATRTVDVIDYTRHAAQVGCVGTLVLPPIYINNDERETAEFFRRVGGEGGLPIMLYNSPRYVNTTLTPGLVKQLLEIDEVVAIKDTSFDLYNASDLMRACGPELKLFIGLEDLYVPALAIGAVGSVAMMPQIVGAMAIELYETARAGKREEALALHYRMARLYDIFKVGSGYIAIKEAMKLMGRPAGHSRPPMLPFTDQQRDQLRAILQDAGVLATA
ncbi:MAG: dihydrodipicolinate synthase family protein [Pseudomonadota bacterium]